MKRIFFVVNPNAAAGRARKHFLKAWRAVSKEFPATTYRYTTGAGDATRIVRQALAEGFDTIVVVGGDGTNNEALNGFMNEEGGVRNPYAVLGFYPSGTGGDLRRVLRLPETPEALIRYLRDDRRKKIDCGLAQFISHEGRKTSRYFLNILSFGLSGLVVHIVNTSSKVLGGRLSFLIGTLRALFQYRDLEARILIDKEVVYEGPLRLAAIANGRFFGGGMMVAPEAQLDDGLFDVVVFEKMGLLEFLRLSNTIYSGRHITHPKIHLFRGRTVSVSGPYSLWIDLDGEDPGTTPLHVRLIAQCVNVLELV